MLSADFCTLEYRGTPLREMNSTMRNTGGHTASMTMARCRSMISVMMVPPMSSRGARMPARCIMNTKLYTL